MFQSSEVFEKCPPRKSGKGARGNGMGDQPVGGVPPSMPFDDFN